MSDEESPEKTGRRTRSGRTVKAAAPITSRTTRRTRRTNPEPEPENVHEEIPEETPFEEAPVQELLADDTPVQATIISPVVETPIEEKLAEDEDLPAPIEGAAVENLAEDAPEGEGEAMVPPEDEKSSSFPFGEQSSADREDMNNINRESGDNLFIANLAAEENANSLPSGTDDNEIRDYEGVATNSATLASEVQKDDTKNDSDDCAIAEDLPNGQDSPGKQTDPDTEMVSEDELPAPTQPKVQDAEEVSDDELPGPKLAELPADTEVVSEDELPAAGKGKRKADEGYDPGSPTESTEAPEKKAKIESVAEEPKKKLPDLDKYWKAVNDDPTDFTAWTYLLQYVDQEVDIEAAREAYDAFLAHYPYCYGYWRKYADYEKRRGNKKKCEEVFERGLKAIPLSVDLWIHYLGHVKGNYGEDESFVRSQFERALGACGLEFRSDKLWEAYIKWETEGKRVANVVSIYDRLLCTPTQGYNGHFDSFSEIVSNNAPQVLVTVDEFKRVRREVRDVAGTKSTKAAEDDVTIVEADKENVEKNEDSEKDNEEKMEVEEEAKSGIEPNMKAVNEEKPEEVEADDHVANDEEAQAIKDKILSIRRKLHKQTVAAVTARWVYEEAIKRPYFHVKPLERCQLKNWKDYLDYEIEQGDRKRVLVLFERCLIACALYEEFWLKLIRYLESQNDAELAVTTRDAFERACTVHHPDKPSLHLMWSAFEEVQNNYQKAAEVLTNLEKVCPNLLQVAYRRINLERRRGDYVKCSQLYEHYIGVAKGKNMASSLAIKYARFCHKVKGDLDGGMEVLKVALEKDSSNTRIALQMIDLALQRAQVEETEVVEIMDSFMAREGMDAEQKVLFAQRKVEFLEDFGSTARGLQDAQRELQLALAKANESKKKASSTEVASAAKKSSTKDSQPPLPTTGTGNSSTYSSYNYSGSGQAAASGYYGSGATAAQSGYGSYTDANYGYNHWNQYGQTGYSGYSQWSGYGNYY